MTRRSALGLASIVTAGVLAGAFYKPIWTIPSGRQWPGNDERVPLVDGLAHLPEEPGETFWANHRFDVLRCATRALLAFLGGAFMYWISAPRRRPPEAADYAEGPGGAAPDVGPAPPAG
jgi:hypothetical protein